MNEVCFIEKEEPKINLLANFSKKKISVSGCNYKPGGYTFIFFFVERNKTGNFPITKRKKNTKHIEIFKKVPQFQ